MTRNDQCRCIARNQHAHMALGKTAFQTGRDPSFRAQWLLGTLLMILHQGDELGARQHVRIRVWEMAPVTVSFSTISRDWTQQCAEKGDSETPNTMLAAKPLFVR